MYRVQVQVCHRLEEMCRGRRSGDRNTDRLNELLRLGISAEEGVDGGSGVEVRNVLFFQETPDEWVIDAAKAVVRAPNGGDGPGECPSLSHKESVLESGGFSGRRAYHSMKHR